jgi:hypothetical protein
MVAPLVLFIGALLLIFLLQKDYFFKWALTARGSTIDTNIFIKKARYAYASCLSIVMLYCLQAAVLVLARVVISVWNIKRSCSSFDHTVVVYGRIFCLFVIVVVFYLGVLFFAGVKNLRFKSLTVGWAAGIFDLLRLTMGQWTPSTVHRFEVVERSKKFDNDDTDDDNQQEMVMKLIGQSRGLVWMAVPYGILLTKSCETLNHPPVFIWGADKNYPSEFKMRTGWYYRFLMWILNCMRLFVIIVTVLFATQHFEKVYFFATVAFVFLEVLKPDPEGLPFEQLSTEQQDQIIKQHLRIKK